MYVETEKDVPVVVNKKVEPGTMIRLHTTCNASLLVKFAHVDLHNVVLYSECDMRAYMLQQNKIAIDKKIFTVDKMTLAISHDKEVYLHQETLLYESITHEKQAVKEELKAGDELGVYVDCQWTPRREIGKVLFSNDEFITVVADDVPFTFGRNELSNIVHVQSNGARYSCRFIPTVTYK
ncbi:hypothetical protein VPFG_00062 [Vibrio phage nt-1]|uniref:Uncharacterized protein n=1 Tax=Vibrio phage nt-1 TaxID=115992 RepID=R9TI93_9CAUD|nr:hypothetical protein VPFG_00062 [Vibrio phage nt-1]AGN30065.2 hypothetical protein VPFG_00062 [Vibrio phage nt-1]